MCGFALKGAQLPDAEQIAGVQGSLLLIAHMSMQGVIDAGGVARTVVPDVNTARTAPAGPEMAAV